MKNPHGPRVRTPTQVTQSHPPSPPNRLRVNSSAKSVTMCRAKVLRSSANSSSAICGLLLVLFSCAMDTSFLGGVSATDRPPYRTTYACEGSTLTMECDPGHVINLIRANYGRFSITICNDHGNTEWSVNCMSRRSHRVLHDKCSQRQNCSVPASTRGFGDPCPGTLKYLEAQFQCVPVNLPHGRPRPVWLVDAQSTVSSITGDHPLRRPPPFRNPNSRVNGSPKLPGTHGDSSSVPGPGDLDVVSGISNLPGGNFDSDGEKGGDGSPRGDDYPSGGRESDGSTSSTTTLRPPPWLKTNVTTKNATTSTTTTTTSAQPPSTSSTTPEPPPKISDDDSSSSPASSHLLRPSYGGEGFMEEEERSLEREEDRERDELLEEQNRLLEEELNHSFPPQRGMDGGNPEDSFTAASGWRPQEPWCGPSSARGLLWNWTRPGDTAVHPCPGGASGWARRTCLPGGWAPRADLGGCLSVWLSTLTSRANGSDSVLAVGHDLSAVTAVRALYGGDVTAAARLLSSLVKRMARSLYHFPDTQQREALLAELLSATLSSASHLIGSQEEAWRDLRPDEHRSAATTLLLALEQAAFLLADNLRQQDVVRHSYPNILMRLQVLETRNVAHITFPSPSEIWQIPTHQSPHHSPSMEPAASSIILNPLSTASSSPHPSQSPPPGSYDSITLPPEALLENSESGLIKMVFFSYRGLEDLLQPSHSSYLSEDPHFMSTNNSRRLNSRVLAASLGSGRHIELSEPVVITFALLQTVNVTNPSCVFWDYTTSSWSDEGCRVVGSNSTHLTCHCDHLTNFAVLMDFHASPISPEHDFALSIITYVGCVVSIVCLLLAIVVFHFFKGLKSDRTSIHKNLCVCLLIAEVVFLAGVNQTSNAIVCGVVAGLLHYFFLAAFAWMFMEGLQLYLMLVEVFEAERSRMKYYCMLSYGIPALIVMISAAVDPYSYGTGEVCWLSTDNYFIFAFVGPVILVILANTVFLTLSLFVLCRHNASSAAIKNKEHTKLGSVRTWLRGAFVLMFLLGITWTFGVLYLNKHTLVMAYIFTVLNSLQGLFIFIFHCMQNDKKYSFKSCGRDSGNGGSEQEESPRTNTSGKLTSLRLNSNGLQTPQDRLVSPGNAPAHLLHLPPSTSPDALLPDYRLSNSADGVIRLPPGHHMLHPAGGLTNASARYRNQSPYNHTYTEISEGGKSLNGVPGRIDPVYEEIERERQHATELQVSDMSDEDRRVSSDVSRQSSRSYGDHRPLLPYNLADHLHTSMHHLPHHLQQQLQQQNHLQQVAMQQQHNLQQQILNNQLQQQHFHIHHHPHHHHPGIHSPTNADGGGSLYGETLGQHPLAPRGGGEESAMVQPLSEPNLRSWEAVQHHRDLQQLQQHFDGGSPGPGQQQQHHHMPNGNGGAPTQSPHMINGTPSQSKQVPTSVGTSSIQQSQMVNGPVPEQCLPVGGESNGEMSVSVLSGEQVLCKLKSTLAPIQESSSGPNSSPDSNQQTSNSKVTDKQHHNNIKNNNQQQGPMKHPVACLTYSHC